MTHWGIAHGNLDISDGYFEAKGISVIEPEKLQGKQVRTNSSDLYVAEQLAHHAFDSVTHAKVVFVELPVGSQSANGMKAYGMCLGVCGALRAKGVQIIEVNALDVKKALTGNRNATKKQMIDAAMAQYPDLEWPTYKHKGKMLVSESKAEHMADGLGAIHAGVMTPEFKNLLALLRKVQ